MNPCRTRRTSRRRSCTSSRSPDQADHDSKAMTTRYDGRTPPGRVSGRAGAQSRPHRCEPSGAAGRLTVHDKVLLLTGADSWRTQGAEALGLRPMITSDGPAGVRGMVMDERHPSSSLPCPSALGATWDPELGRRAGRRAGRRGAGQGRRRAARADDQPDAHAARRPRLRVLLRGPGADRPARRRVRARRAGRRRRRDASSTSSATTRRRSAGPTTPGSPSACCASCTWSRSRPACARPGVALVMAAYNRVNGIPMTEHARLLRDVLKDEWGFDGVVTSDWHAARSTAATALAALDLAMPGPDGPWGEQLAAGGDRRRGHPGGAGRQGDPAAPAGPPGRRARRSAGQRTARPRATAARRRPR